MTLAWHENGLVLSSNGTGPAPEGQQHGPSLQVSIDDSAWLATIFTWSGTHIGGKLMKILNIFPNRSVFKLFDWSYFGRHHSWKLGTVARRSAASWPQCISSWSGQSQVHHGSRTLIKGARTRVSTNSTKFYSHVGRHL